MGSADGLSTEQLELVVGPLADFDHADAPFSESERAALAYAEAMTTDDVSDELFARVAQHFDHDALVELTAVIAFENSSARFNRALRVPSQNLWTTK